MSEKAKIGIIGLGVMGSSLAINFASKGIAVAGYNRNVPGVEEDVAKKFVEANPDYNDLQGFDDPEKFIDSLEKPRKILLMVSAGAAVDAVIEGLLPVLQEGDIIMDGGNSLYKDTDRRAAELAVKGIHFLGVGVSGGEEGARKGPSIMPGGDEDAYRKVEAILKKVAAKDKNGDACCTYIGKGGAGHFVKMVHNGIEYAEMQLIAEVFMMLKEYLNLDEAAIADIFKEWNASESGSFLLEITIDILQKKEGDELLLNKILDAAEQKGTGWWSAAAAMEMSMPYSVITEAVMARNISAQKERRVKYSELYNIKKGTGSPGKEYISTIHTAYRQARIINHAIGFDLIFNSNDIFKSEFNLSEIARIWTNGCIIRSKLMEQLVEYYAETPHVLEHREVVSHIKKGHDKLSEVVADGAKSHIALPVLAAALNYFIGITTANSPANLIQAQRDYFGAHTYRRTDKPYDKYFHTDW